MQPDCVSCCFFRLVETKGKQRRLCMFTGARRPYAGMDGCQFLAGEWADIGAILGLPKSRLCGNLNFPNYAKPVAAYFHKGENVAKLQNIAIDDSIGFPINHTAEKLEGSLVRPGTRKGQVARIARERTQKDCLLTFNPNYARQTCLIQSA